MHGGDAPVAVKHLQAGARLAQKHWVASDIMHSHTLTWNRSCVWGLPTTLQLHQATNTLGVRWRLKIETGDTGTSLSSLTVIGDRGTTWFMVTSGITW